MIAKTLDGLKIDFTYEPKQFLTEHRIIPDFELKISGKSYYLEHLGNMQNFSYKQRWYKKFETYKKLGLENVLITTSESEEKGNIENKIGKIVQDITNNTLLKSEGGYSLHHYGI